MSDTPKKAGPSPMLIAGMGLAVMIALIAVAIGLEQFGPAVNRNTKAIFICILAAAIVVGIFVTKKIAANNAPPLPETLVKTK